MLFMVYYMYIYWNVYIYIVYIIYMLCCFFALLLAYFNFLFIIITIIFQKYNVLRWAMEIIN